jgi:hypothetical protein
MTKTLSIQSIEKWLQKIDWKLLVFLLLFLNVKLIVKLVAVIFIYLVRNNFKLGFKVTQSRLPVFYLIAIAIAALDYVALVPSITLNYTVAFVIGICFWWLCILATHQIKLAVEQRSTTILYNTLLVFFIINIAASLINITSIIAEIHTINPYRYQGQYQKYFINTGDYIKGITFDTSTTNAIINAFGVVYFLFRKNFTMVVGCMIVLLLTASNFTNIILLLVLAFLFAFKSTPDQKSVMLVCTMLLVVFLSKVSPQNDQYVLARLKKFTSSNSIPSPTLITKVIPLQERPDSELTVEEKNKKIALLYLDSLDRARMEKERPVANANAGLDLSSPDKISIPEPSIHTAPFQSKKDTTSFQRKLFSFIAANKSNLNLSTANDEPRLPGKAIAAKEALTFLRNNPEKIFAGAGIGNFSSKLAFKATAFNVEGSYPKKYSYISPAFLQNHFDIYLYYFTRHADEHSLTNTPNSVYGQLLTEYGVVGFLAFVIGYVGFFLKDYKRLTYALPLMFLLLSAFAIDYWFEQLSIVVLFELMMFLNIKENQNSVNG